MPKNKLLKRQYLDVYYIKNASQKDICKYQTMCRVHRFLLRLKKDVSFKLRCLIAFVLLSNSFSCLSYNLILSRLDSNVVDILFGLKILIFDITTCLKISDLIILRKELKEEVNSVVDDMDEEEATFEITEEVVEPKREQLEEKQNIIPAVTPQNEKMRAPIFYEYPEVDTLEDIPDVAVSGATIDTVYPSSGAKAATRVRKKFYSMR